MLAVGDAVPLALIFIPLSTPLPNCAKFLKCVGVWWGVNLSLERGRAALGGRVSLNVRQSAFCSFTYKFSRLYTMDCPSSPIFQHVPLSFCSSAVLSFLSCLFTTFSSSSVHWSTLFPLPQMLFCPLFVSFTSSQLRIDYILCRQRWRSSIESAKTRPGADCGSDNELLIAKFRIKLKKVGKTTRPFRYDLNQIPYSGSDK